MLQSVFKETDDIGALREVLSAVLLCNTQAINFCVSLLSVYHVWDDLIDGDRQPSADEINQAFIICLSDIPRNPFFKKHEDRLRPLIESSIFQWMDANVLEKGSVDDKRKAYMLRAGIVQIFCYCAYLIGGYDHYKTAGLIMQKSYTEDYDQFIKEHS